jgi:HlyD family secretion protein
MKSVEQPSSNFRRPAIIGLSLVVLLFCGGIAWAYLSEISGAVIAQGTVNIEGKPKVIQHADGGIVKSIEVSAGDRVKEGDVLVELDGTTLAANLSIYRSRLRDALVRRSRLLGELDGKSDLLPLAAADIETYVLSDIDASFEQQRVLMRARALTRQGELEQFDDKVAQLDNQISGATSLKEQKLLQISVYAKEEASVSQLIAKNIVAKNQLLTFERATADLRGQVAEQDAEIARLRNSISETKTARAQIDKQMREKNINELEEVEAKIDEMKQQILATDLQMKRTSIRSPVEGVVHELSMHTIGGVVQAGQAIMQIIPASSDLVIEVNADTRSIDEIKLDREAIVRFPAFHQRTTPEIFGKVTQISPSSVVDEKTGAAFYRVKITVPVSEKLKLGDSELVPGMPVEAVMPTGSRTVLSYLLKPLTDQMEHALREQ